MLVCGIRPDLLFQSVLQQLYPVLLHLTERALMSAKYTEKSFRTGSHDLIILLDDIL